MWILNLQKLTLQLFLDIIYFPVWWYSFGIVTAFDVLRARIRDGNEQFVPLLWLKNIFVPMYGQYDWQGRLMSVFMRFVNIIGRSIALLIWTLVVFALTMLWICAPVLLVVLILWSIF
jgi:hypothetical protein